jgi:hypothetical protein
MNQKSKAILKRYIRHVLLQESQALDTHAPGNASLTFELAKSANRALPIGPGELDKIKSAIKHVYPEISSIDTQNTQIVFDKQATPNNFHIVIRKIRNSPNVNQFKYVMWYVPFVETEDIDKPGSVHKKESSPFDNKITRAQLLSNIYDFFVNALLMN